MPISAQVSLWGMYKLDSTILDGLSVPTGMDADNLKQSLLIETASMEILYPDCDFLKAAISIWSAERADVWNRLYATTQLTYNPIENYNRVETGSRQENTGSTGNSTSTSQANASSNANRVSNSNSTGESSSTAANTAYNSNDFADTAKNSSTGENHALTTDNSTDNSNSETSTTSSGNSTAFANAGYSTHISGNIGVTTSQQMIQQERDISLFCMAQFIIDDFISRFCVAVY